MLPFVFDKLKIPHQKTGNLLISFSYFSLKSVQNVRSSPKMLAWRRLANYRCMFKCKFLLLCGFSTSSFSPYSSSLAFFLPLIIFIRIKESPFSSHIEKSPLGLCIVCLLGMVGLTAFVWTSVLVQISSFPPSCSLLWEQFVCLITRSSEPHNSPSSECVSYLKIATHSHQHIHFS